MTDDSATAYETHARAFLDIRDRSDIGAAVVERWARSLSPGTETLEIGCGGGLPVTRALIDAGLKVWATDASPTMISEFRERFPDLPAVCERIQDGACFNRRFGALIAVGLVFLLDEADQRGFVARASALLEPGGRFLFSAPVEAGTWDDLTTGIQSLSLGRGVYEALLDQAGFRVVGCHTDNGNGNYYDVELR